MYNGRENKGWLLSDRNIQIYGLFKKDNFLYEKNFLKKFKNHTQKKYTSF